VGTAAVTNIRHMGGLPHAQSKQFLRCTITPSASYATGGETIPMASLPIAQVTDMYVLVAGSLMQVAVPAQTGGGLPGLASPGATPKFQIFVGGGTRAELAAAQNLSAESWDVILGGYTK